MFDRPMPGYDSQEAVAARAAFNAKLTAAGGTAFTGWYWSSTDMEAGMDKYAWVVVFNNATVTALGRDLRQRVRVVMAF